MAAVVGVGVAAVVAVVAVGGRKEQESKKNQYGGVPVDHAYVMYFNC